MKRWGGLALAIVVVLVLLLGLRTRVRPAAAPLASAQPKAARGLGRPARLGGGKRRPVDLAAAERTDETDGVGALEGVVRSRGDGRGIAGAELAFFGGTLHTVRADAAGRFVFRPEREGVYELAFASAHGFLPFSPAWGHSPLVYVARRGVGLRGAHIELSPAIDYRARVLSDAGDPVPGATVRLLGERADDLLEPPPPIAPTDERGETVFHAPDDAVVEASHPEHGRARGRVDFAVQVGHELVLRLRRDLAAADAALRGSVTTADGAPAPDALVTASFVADNPAGASARLAPTAETITAEDGTFELAGLDAGRWEIVASLAGWAPARAEATAPGEGVALRLERGLAIRGVVRDAATGAPIPAFAVVVLEPRGPLVRDTVDVEPTFDADGRYEIVALAPGTYFVTVSAHGYAVAPERQVVLAGDDAEVDFDLGRGGSIAGRVLDADTDLPIGGARVSLESHLGSDADEALPVVAGVVTGPDGRFELTGVGAELGSIFVAAAGHHGRVLGGLVVPAGGHLEVTVPLTPVKPGEDPKIELVGIGAVLSGKDDALVVGQVIEGGGAAEAGIVPGDAILAVDGVTVVDLGFGPSIQRIRGPEGSVVTLAVRRGSSTIVIAVPRKRIRA